MFHLLPRAQPTIAGTASRWKPHREQCIETTRDNYSASLNHFPAAPPIDTFRSLRGGETAALKDLVEFVGTRLRNHT